MCDQGFELNPSHISERAVSLGRNCIKFVAFHRFMSFILSMNTFFLGGDQKIMAKTILITGASSGFGRLTAETLAESGHRVFAGFRSTDGDRKKAADDLKNRKVEVVKLDVTDEESVNLAVKNLLGQTNGELDVVINNAGIASAGISETFTSEQLHDLFDVNVFGIHRVIRATLPTMRKKQSGLIINIGSILGRVTIPFFGLYG